MWITPSASIAALHRIGNDADGEKIVDLVERDLLAFEFLIYGIGALDAGFDARRNPFAAELRFHCAAHAFEILFVGRALGFDGVGNFRERFGIEMPEGEILQFAADLAHAETVRDGGIDFQCFAGDALAALGAQIAERPHVVQPVGQLDDDDADVVHHREQHLAIAFRLPILGREEIDFTQFGDAIDAARRLQRRSSSGCRRW